MVVPRVAWLLCLLTLAHGRMGIGSWDDIFDDISCDLGQTLSPGLPRPDPISLPPHPTLLIEAEPPTQQTPNEGAPNEGAPNEGGPTKEPIPPQESPYCDPCLNQPDGTLKRIPMPLPNEVNLRGQDAEVECYGGNPYLPLKRPNWSFHAGYAGGSSWRNTSFMKLLVEFDNRFKDQAYSAIHYCVPFVRSGGYNEAHGVDGSIPYFKFATYEEAPNYSSNYRGLLMWGQANDCLAPNSMQGRAMIDLAGTNVLVYNVKWITGGYIPQGSDGAADGQTMLVKGGGYCGWRQPEGERIFLSSHPLGTGLTR